jgi:DNA-binding response OmpR family regulator
MKEKKIYDLKILYVEDEVDTLKPMERFLRRRFSSVIIAKDGENGWNLFKENRPDLIITDLLIPEFSGIDLIKKIRETGYSNPIIVTSALQDPVTIVHAVDFGISKYIIKPINMAELDTVLEKISTEVLEQQKITINLTYPQKKECEASLKHFISNLLKQRTGKGPKDIKVTIGSDKIDIYCIEVRTTLEDTLFEDGKNEKLIEQSRWLLYQILRNRIDAETSAIVGTRVGISDVSIDVMANRENITLSCMNL